jgi:hypothetical protein
MRAEGVRREAVGMLTTAPHTAPEPPSVEERLEDVSSLVGFIPQAGPPPFILAGALVFGGLMLAGPFAFAVVLVAAMGLAAALFAAVVAIAASPYLLVRWTRRYVADHPFRLAGHRARVAAPVVVHREPVA